MSKLIQQFETFLRRKPALGKNVYIAKGAMVLDDVTLGDNASVWYNAILRNGINRIVIEEATSKSLGFPSLGGETSFNPIMLVLTRGATVSLLQWSENLPARDKLVFSSAFTEL